MAAQYEAVIYGVYNG